MKDGYRRFLVITIVLLSAFLVVVLLRRTSNNPGLLEFLKNSGPIYQQNTPEEVTLKLKPIQ